MSDRDTVLELVKRLPANLTLREILGEIEFIAAMKDFNVGKRSGRAFEFLINKPVMKSIVHGSILNN